MKLKLSKQISGILIIGAVLFSGVAYVIASDSLTIQQDASIQRIAFSTCKHITNESSTGLSVYVPTVTSAEWASFYNNPPTGVLAC